MGFEDVVAVLGQAFNLELKVVQGTQGLGNFHVMQV